MNTGTSYLLPTDLGRNLDDLARKVDSFGHTSLLIDDIEPHSFGQCGTAPSECAALTPGRPLPLAGLEPHMLDESHDDVDDYATRCLASSSIESLFDVVIATAELRAGTEVVRRVLVTMATAPEGSLLAELTGGDDELAVSVTHVLSVLGNHILRSNDRYLLTPVLRAAVERRYPLGRRTSANAALKSSIRPADAVAVSRSQQWRGVA